MFDKYELVRRLANRAVVALEQIAEELKKHNERERQKTL